MCDRDRDKTEREAWRERMLGKLQSEAQAAGRAAAQRAQEQRDIEVPHDSILLFRQYLIDNYVLWFCLKMEHVIERLQRERSDERRDSERRHKLEIEQLALVRLYFSNS